MRLYRMVGKEGDYGFAEWNGEGDLNLEGGLWRPATRAEYAYHYLFRYRFSYVDLLAILVASAIISALDLDWWWWIPLLGVLALIVLLGEKRLR